MRSFLSILLFCYLAAASSHAKWQRLPHTERIAINLASCAISGTSIALSRGLTNAESLLSEDATQAATLSRGESEVVIRLGAHQVIESFRFLNDGIQGTVAFHASADGETWTLLGRTAITAGRRTVEQRFAGTLSRYIKMEFSVAHGGSLRTFKVYGPAQDTDYSVVPEGNTAGEGGENQRLDVNWASGLGDARPIYAWPTPSNLGTPSFAENLFRFPGSPNKHRTIIYDLGEMRDIQRFSTAYSKRPARLKIYVFSGLPEARDWRGKLTLDPALFDLVEPVAIGNDPDGAGHLKHEPGKPVSARFIALRFEFESPVEPGQRTSWNPGQRDAPFALASLMPGERAARFGDDLLQPLASSTLGFFLAKLNLIQASRFVQMPALPDSAADAGPFVATIEMSEHGLSLVPSGQATLGAQISYAAYMGSPPFTAFGTDASLPSAAANSRAIYTPAARNPVARLRIPNVDVVTP